MGSRWSFLSLTLVVCLGLFSRQSSAQSWTYCTIQTTFLFGNSTTQNFHISNIFESQKLGSFEDEFEKNIKTNFPPRPGGWGGENQYGTTNCNHSGDNPKAVAEQAVSEARTMKNEGMSIYFDPFPVVASDTNNYLQYQYSGKSYLSIDAGTNFYGSVNANSDFDFTLNPSIPGESRSVGIPNMNRYDPNFTVQGSTPTTGRYANTSVASNPARPSKSSDEDSGQLSCGAPSGGNYAHTGSACRARQAPLDGADGTTKSHPVPPNKLPSGCSYVSENSPEVTCN